MLRTVGWIRFGQVRSGWVRLGGAVKQLKVFLDVYVMEERKERKGKGGFIFVFLSRLWEIYLAGSIERGMNGWCWLVSNL